MTRWPRARVRVSASGLPLPAVQVTPALAWQVQALDEHHLLIPEEQPYPTIYTKALDDTAVSLTLQQLQQDGWHIQGQLTLAFTGRDAIANFEQTYRQYLWQQPTATDQNS